MIDLYVKFREEIDRMAFPLICAIDGIVIKEIKDGDETVGFIMVDRDYIDSMYIKPEHRRKGLGRKAVREYVMEYGLPETLRIVKTNTIAKKFWKSVFNMRVVDRNEVDVTYLIEGLK